MATFLDQSCDSLRDACHVLLSQIRDLVTLHDHQTWKINLTTFDEQHFFYALRDVVRIAYRSRDTNIAFFGIGAADLVDTDDSLNVLMKKAPSLFDEQIYFGAMRFDQNCEIAKEWKKFGKRLFVLPFLVVKQDSNQVSLSLNYRHDAHLSFGEWLDQAMKILRALIEPVNFPSDVVDAKMEDVTPSQEKYFANIKSAQALFAANPSRKKVVIGRRRSMVIDHKIDPITLYFRLEHRRNAFLFFFDNGKGSAFFGGSPELLYRRKNLTLETESLAGTRPRASLHDEDMKLKNALLKSNKDNREHALVSLHIEEKLHDLGISDLFVSDLQIMALSYVQHLLKRYRGTLNTDVNDENILTALHPTPAVCGLDARFAFSFINEHEGFDRGFYAGPIGYIGKNDAEFAVAIRSALFDAGRIYVYAASGIVLESECAQEWDELTNKEKNILSIFF